MQPNVVRHPAAVCIGARAHAQPPATEQVESQPVRPTASSASYMLA